MRCETEAGVESAGGCLSAEGSPPQGVMKLLSCGFVFTPVTAALPGNRLSSRSSEGVTTEFRFTGLDVGESGYRVPAGTLLSQ